MHARRQQRPILGKDPLRDHAPAVPRPRRLHLRKHPLIRAQPPRLVEVDAVVQAHQHAQARPVLPCVHVEREALERQPSLQLQAQLLGQLGNVLGRDGEAPQRVHARHRADEVAVRHVRQRVEVRLVAALWRDAAARARPLAALALVRLSGVICADGVLLTRCRGRPDVHGQALRNTNLLPWLLAVPVVGRRLDPVGQRNGVAGLLGAGAVLADEADGGGEDAAALLARLDGAGGKGAAVADALDVEEDGDGGGAGEQEVAVARVAREVVRNRQMRRCEALRDDGAAVDAPRGEGLPGLAGVGEDVLRVMVVRIYTDIELGRKIRVLTGPSTFNSVTSSAFSIGALLGSGSGGFTNVVRSSPGIVCRQSESISILFMGVSAVTCNRATKSAAAGVP